MRIEICSSTIILGLSGISGRFELFEEFTAAYVPDCFIGVSNLEEVCKREKNSENKTHWNRTELAKLRHKNSDKVSRRQGNMFFIFDS